jgi:type I restriction enzyme M protein
MMVRLRAAARTWRLRPHCRLRRHADPDAEYLREHGGNADELALYGQESNGNVWSICKMNMLLHGIAHADMRNDDTLREPQHVEGGELMRFDRVLTNPPFSQNYTSATSSSPSASATAH